MDSENLTREQVHAARDLLNGNVNDLQLLNFPVVLRLHNFLNAWNGGTKEQLVESCEKIVRSCGEEEKIAIQKYFFLPETRLDSSGDCILPWCRELSEAAGTTLTQEWMVNRLKEIHEKRANFRGCGKEYTLNETGKETTLKILREAVVDNPKLTIVVKVVTEVLEDARYQKTSSMMEVMTLRLKCLDAKQVGKLQEVLSKQKQRGYVDWLLGAFQFALLPEVQEEVPFGKSQEDDGKLKKINAFG